MKPIIDISVYAFGNAAQNTGCAHGATTLKTLLIQSDFTQNLHFHPMLQTASQKQQDDALLDIKALCEKLAVATADSVKNNRFFITLGGDHSAAIGSWSGAASIIENCGLIWFDAHMDAHTRETTPSKNIHGMPLAILLGHGETELTHLAFKNQKIKPENCVLIGIRSYESGEADLLKKLGVKIFYMDDIKKMTLSTVIQQAIEIVTRNTDYFGVSIDLDGFDPIDAPGVGSPANDGIRAAEFLPEFKYIAQHPQLIGADIVEFNPMLDVEGKTAQLAITLINGLVKARA